MVGGGGSGIPFGQKGTWKHLMCSQVQSGKRREGEKEEVEGIRERKKSSVKGKASENKRE